MYSMYSILTIENSFIFRKVIEKAINGATDVTVIYSMFSQQMASIFLSSK